MLTIQETTVTLESIDRFRSSLCAGGRAEQTAKAYATDLKVMFSELGETEILTTEFEQSAQNWLTGTRKFVAPKTTTRRLTSLRSFGRWLGLGPILADYKAPTPAPGQPHPVPEGVAGLRRMVEVSANEKQRALVALCGLCGCRVGEALAIKPSDIDLHRMVVKVRGKGDKTRYVPLSPEAWEILQMPVTRAFVDGDREIISMSNRFARRVITNLGAKADLGRPIASHDLRATFATAVYDKTKDIRLVQVLLGHSSVDTTQLYVDVVENKLREAVVL